MNATYSEAIQLTIEAAMGLALSLGMNQQGISLTDPETRGKALGYLSIFCLACVVGMMVLTALSGE